jgi:DNA-binding NtrC family response regulator
LAEGAPFGRGRRILLVDDDDAVLGIVETVLARCGFVTDAHANPMQALERFAAAPQDFTAVISDLTMPGISGVELARRLHEVRQGIPFILASGNLHAQALANAQQTGITHFVKKPFDLEELMSLLRAVLDPRPA